MNQPIIDEQIKKSLHNAFFNQGNQYINTEEIIGILDKIPNLKNDYKEYNILRMINIIVLDYSNINKDNLDKIIVKLKELLPEEMVKFNIIFEIIKKEPENYDLEKIAEDLQFLKNANINIIEYQEKELLEVFYEIKITKIIKKIKENENINIEQTQKILDNIGRVFELFQMNDMDVTKENLLFEINCKAIFPSNKKYDIEKITKLLENIEDLPQIFSAKQLEEMMMSVFKYTQLENHQELLDLLKNKKVDINKYNLIYLVDIKSKEEKKYDLPLIKELLDEISPKDINNLQINREHIIFYLVGNVYDMNDSIKIIQIFIEKGLKIDQVKFQEKEYGDSLLHMAINLEDNIAMVEFLINNNIVINIQDNHKLTPLIKSLLCHERKNTALFLILNNALILEDKDIIDTKDFLLNLENADKISCREQLEKLINVQITQDVKNILIPQLKDGKLKSENEFNFIISVLNLPTEEKQKSILNMFFKLDLVNQEKMLKIFSNADAAGQEKMLNIFSNADAAGQERMLKFDGYSEKEQKEILKEIITKNPEDKVEATKLCISLILYKYEQSILINDQRTKHIQSIKDNVDQTIADLCDTKYRAIKNINNSMNKLYKFEDNKAKYALKKIGELIYFLVEILINSDLDYIKDSSKFKDSKTERLIKESLNQLRDINGSNVAK